MPQTKKGAARSEWIIFLRKCASDFHAQKKQDPQASKTEKRLRADQERAGENHRRHVEQQAVSAIRSADAAQSDKIAIDMRERRKKQVEMQREKTQKKRAKAVVKQLGSGS